MWRCLPWDPDAAEGAAFSASYVGRGQTIGRFDLHDRPPVRYLARISGARDRGSTGSVPWHHLSPRPISGARGTASRWWKRSWRRSWSSVSPIVPIQPSSRRSACVRMTWRITIGRSRRRLPADYNDLGDPAHAYAHAYAGSGGGPALHRRVGTRPCCSRIASELARYDFTLARPLVPDDPGSAVHCRYLGIRVA